MERHEADHQLWQHKPVRVRVEADAWLGVEPFLPDDLSVEPCEGGFEIVGTYGVDTFPDHRFVLLVGDHLYLSHRESSCVAQLLQLSATHDGCISAVNATHESKLHLYGTIGASRNPADPSLYEVHTILEKPTPTLAEQELWVERLADRAESRGLLDELVQALEVAPTEVAGLLAADFEAQAGQLRAEAR